MVRALDPQPLREHPSDELDGAQRIARRLVRGGQITQNGERLGTIGAPNPFVGGYGPFVHRDGAVELAGGPVGHGEKTPRAQRFRVVRTLDALAVRWPDTKAAR
jgi:hypothetical protein